MERRSLLSAASLALAQSGCLRLAESDEAETVRPNAGTPGADDSGEREDGTTGDERRDGGGEETGVDDGTGRDFEDVEFIHDGGATTATGDGTLIAALPALDVSGTVTMDETVSFTVANLETGDRVTLAVTDERSVEATRVSLYMYDRDGTLRPGSAAVNAWTADGDCLRLGAALDGDGSTFTELERAAYRTTMFREDVQVGSTDAFEMSVGHRQEFEQSVGVDRIEISFNAGELPTGGSLSATVRTDEDRIRSDDARYDSDAHRFRATFDADAIPAGEHRASFRVTDPETGRIDLFLRAVLEV